MIRICSVVMVGVLLQGCAIVPSVSMVSTPYRDRICFTVDERTGGSGKVHTAFMLRCIDLKDL